MLTSLSIVCMVGDYQILFLKYSPSRSLTGAGGGSMVRIYTVVFLDRDRQSWRGVCISRLDTKATLFPCGGLFVKYLHVSNPFPYCICLFYRNLNFFYNFIIVSFSLAAWLYKSHAVRVVPTVHWWKKRERPNMTI